jgi:hypothetical protein
MEVSEEGAKALGASMSMVGDKRWQYGYIRHKLTDIIVIAFVEVLARYEDYGEIEMFGHAKETRGEKYGQWESGWEKECS